jgi:ferredoxin-thioredoxin reductase catalytic chain
LTTLEKVRQRAELDARARGYRLNPDPAFLKSLLEGLLTNEERYGYPSCPCRIATGDFDLDWDIVCPCNYRDPDVEEHGTCYCCLYMDEKTHESGETRPIPERRPAERAMKAYGPETAPAEGAERSPPKTGRRLMYCKQCGYVVFREEPPYVCPICRAKREMFAEVNA